MEHPNSNSHFNGGSAPVGGGPVLNVPPLRAISPMYPPPPPTGFPATGPAFVYVSPFSPMAAQFATAAAAGEFPSRNPQAGDPAEVQRKREQDVASKEKRAQRACAKSNNNNDNKDSEGSNDDKPSERHHSEGSSEQKPSKKDAFEPSRKKCKKQGMPKSEVFGTEDNGFTPPAATADSSPKISATPSKGPKVSGEASEGLTGKKRKKQNRSTKGTTVFRAPEVDVDGSSDSAALDRKMVRRALMVYDSLRRKLMQDDEALKEAPGNGSCKRPDLKAGTLMMDRGLCVNRERRIIGAVPGVNVGDLFFFRMELCVIGLHGHVMAGIDYINAKCNEWSEPVATSIISSGGYEDDEDDGETLVYTGQGGNNYKTDKKQTNDQKLERGNLALERSMHHGIEIRVIRGIKDATSPSGKIYVYDGLYKVQVSYLDRGRSGFSVFKYKLQRLPGQPELGSAILKATNQWKSQPSTRQGLLLLDISSGAENVSVCLVNNVDNDKGPSFFEYISKVKYSNNIGTLEPCRGCDCKSGCASGEICSCISLNDGDMPFTSNGYLVKWKPVVYECGDQCKCPPSCRNRVSQKGLKYRLEVFKTNNRGWGVRSWDSIPAGSFVSEYTGEVLADRDREQEDEDEDDDYLLSANNMQENQIACTGISDILYEEKQETSSKPSVKFCISIDASKMGNVSRFIRHSCSPNLFRQAVLYDHHDTQFPHIMLFAMENIPPLTELTLDYGAHKVAGKSKECLCGASGCRGEF